MTKNNTIKLGDFGIARVLKSTMECAKTLVGTPYYLSPELCQEKPYNNKSDVWSLGCVLYEVATQKHAFEGNSMKALVGKILRGIYPPISAKYSKGMRDLIDAMLQKDPKKRPGINSILKQPIVVQRILAKIDDYKGINLSGIIDAPPKPEVKIEVAVKEEKKPEKVVAPPLPDRQFAAMEILRRKEDEKLSARQYQPPQPIQPQQQFPSKLEQNKAALEKLDAERKRIADKQFEDRKKALLEKREEVKKQMYLEKQAQLAAEKQAMLAKQRAAQEKIVNYAAPSYQQEPQMPAQQARGGDIKFFDQKKNDDELAEYRKKLYWDMRMQAEQNKLRAQQQMYGGDVSAPPVQQQQPIPQKKITQVNINQMLLETYANIQMKRKISSMYLKRSQRSL